MRRLPSLLPVLASFLTLAGCAVADRVPELPAAIEARVGAPQPEKKPLDYREICLLPQKASKSDPIVAALKRGAKQAGASVRVLEPDAGTMACPFVLMWELRARGRTVEALHLQPFEWGVPKNGAQISADAGKALTADMVTLHSASYIEYLQQSARKAAVEKAEKNASFTKH